MAINEWLLLGLVLNGPLAGYLLIRLFLFKFVCYADPVNPYNSTVQTKETKSPPVSGAGPPDAGTGGETG